jgi:S-adenosylmethionine:tRNA ribosyltransferase-isomerase
MSHMSDLSNYDFELPTELIAQHPRPRRADARLLVVDRARQAFDHAHVRDLPEFLAAGDCLVLNQSRVIPARLVGYRRATGGRWQGLFLRADEHGIWQLLCKSRGKLFQGEEIILVDLQAREDVSLRLVTRFEDGVWAAVPDGDEPTLDLLERVGRIPLPYYIRRGEMAESDRQAYQTVYATAPGSVAAPTAGLHFTEQLLGEVERRGVGIARLTLHVGLDTFRPVSAGSLDEHRMHREWCQIDEDTAEQLGRVRASGGRIVAVGTTTVRTLETAAAGGTLGPWRGETDLFIRPPYQFRAVDALLTNFHLPRTTLLILVKTFAGDALVTRAYQEAIREAYRFFSYGDAMLIL